MADPGREPILHFSAVNIKQPKKLGSRFKIMRECLNQWVKSVVYPSPLPWVVFPQHLLIFKGISVTTKLR